MWDYHDSCFWDGGAALCLSGWMPFRGERGQVPDGRMTVMLLGAALGSPGMTRRFLKR
jgi:hypothetical protein